MDYIGGTAVQTQHLGFVSAVRFVHDYNYSAL